MSTDTSWTQLIHDDTIRLLELVKTTPTDTELRGRLIYKRLCDEPEYDALSYVWEKAPAEKNVLIEGNQPILIRANLFEGLKQIASDRPTTRIWADQICINQLDEDEKEHQVNLMSRIFCQAKRVIGWLGPSQPDTDLAFCAFRMLGLSYSQNGNVPTGALHDATRDLVNTGRVCSLEDIFSPEKCVWKAAMTVVQMAWFERLWIVQEVVLATKLELCCGRYALFGDLFFAGVEAFFTTVTSPPCPQLLKPFQNALRLGRLREQSTVQRLQSYPHLAQTLSGWHCEKIHDRLNALHGMIFRQPADNSPWFQASNGNKFLFSETDHGYGLHLQPLGKDSPSWVPDWRIQTRPLALLPAFDDEISTRFHATISIPSYIMSTSILQVSGNQVFNQWYQLAKAFFDEDRARTIFASTLLMDGKLDLLERNQVAIDPADIPDYFNEWEVRNLDSKEDCDASDVFVSSMQFLRVVRRVRVGVALPRSGAQLEPAVRGVWLCFLPWYSA
ncbi:hypothetical protein PG993_010725 [Apiospora rasikravindrae]|uniref:Heterokaryon incompatibility domain-containing protein n=1 Tax=Apiospora rasikravindrae TaxID=990691 RepID=A0ABR1SC77_9PEZI